MLLLPSMTLLMKQEYNTYLSMNHNCSIFISVEINLKPLPDFLALLKTSN